MLLVALALAQNGFADLVVVNGKVWTDGALTKHTVVAVKGGRVLALGTDAKKFTGPKTKRVDAKGNWILPGLIDAHTHIADRCVGIAFGLDLRPAKSKEEFVALVKGQADKLGKNDWIEGRGWSVESYPDKTPPSKEWIDAVSGGRPAFLVRMDGHSGLANSKTLALAGITKDGPADPPGGRIERDPVTNEPTGLLADAAMGLIKVPTASMELRNRALPLVIDMAHSHGVTAVGDIMRPASYSLWQSYAKSSRKSFRVGAYVNADSPKTVQWLSGQPKVVGWLEPRGVKMYMDGSLGSRSAYMFEPFTKPLPTQPADWKGLAFPGATDGTYAAIIQESAKRKTQVIIHAIGDRANHAVLNLFQKAPNLKSLRFRVEHVQHLKPADINRFGALGVIPSMQPYHKADDGRYCEDVIGAERSRTSYTFKSLLNSKANLAFGSDFPVVTINPWLGIETAVTGEIEGGKKWMTQENITLNQALDSYTRKAAFAIKMETQIGRLAPGYRGDILVLDRSLKVDGSNLKGTKPAVVIVDGRVVR